MDTSACRACEGTGFQHQLVQTEDSCMVCKGEGTIKRQVRFSEDEEWAVRTLIHSETTWEMVDEDMISKAVGIVQTMLGEGT
jgi:RecJ-like exonuclease